MKALGIDLASQAEKTATCIIECVSNQMRIIELGSRCSDSDLDAAFAAVDATGIDAPLGWPVPFREAVTGWTHEEWNDSLRDKLTLRTTDHWVAKRLKMYPLRVAADRIAMPAMRAMAFLRRHGITDRSGSPEGRVFEVYPAATLNALGILPSGSYKKGKSAEANRRTILKALCRRLKLENCKEAIKTEHALDALISALTAYMAKLGRTIGPTLGDVDVARQEGWIHVPRIPKRPI